MLNLTDFITDIGPCAVAFSGGVDSSVVAAAAYRAHGNAALAVTVVSELCPESEAEEAAVVARFIGIPHIVVRSALLTDETVSTNPPDRCYHCKKKAFALIYEAAGARGITCVADGTNADDMETYRPGLKALAEMGVASPLALLGIRKEGVRELARVYGLPNAEKPSAPCLATRFPYGTMLTPAGIARVQAAEDAVRSLGFTGFRVRDHGEVARIEIDIASLTDAVSEKTRKKLVAMLKSLGYNYVTLDLEGFRSGSMDKR